MLKKLNDTQKKEAEEFLKYYKFVYICNVCGSIYGTDRPEDKGRLCHVCEIKLKKDNNK